MSDQLDVMSHRSLPCHDCLGVREYRIETSGTPIACTTCEDGTVDDTFNNRRRLADKLLAIPIHADTVQADGNPSGWCSPPS